jgi:hypothetical protein
MTTTRKPIMTIKNRIRTACAAVLALSNQAAAEPAASNESGPVIALANHVAADTVKKTAPEWIEIPLGNHDHAQAMQVLDAESAAKMLSNFNTLKESRGARFKGLPVYFGHPDDPKLAAQYPDKRKIRG